MRFVHQTCSLLLCLIPLIGCQTADKPSVYTGTIEGEERLVQSEAGGMLIAASAEEGQKVKANDTLARLDDRDYQLRITEAKTAVTMAQAKLEEANAGTRVEKISEARARLEQAQALTGQAASKQDAAAAQLSILQAKKEELGKRLESARQTLGYQQSRLERSRSLLEAGASSRQEVDTLQEAVNQAQALVNDLGQQQRTLDAQMNQARQEVEAAKAAKDSAKAGEKASQASLELLEAGDTSYTIRSLLAQRDQAESKLGQAILQQRKTLITAPEDGIILRKHVHKGEVIKPGATLYTILKTDQLEVVVYVPEAELNQVQIGKTARIRVDAYPDQSFTGKVTRIASRGEFTPKNVQTPDERTKMVFAVTIQLTNGLDRLKPGMPADITLADDKAGGAK